MSNNTISPLVRHVIDTTVGVIARQLKLAEHTIEQQDKVITNLEDQLADLRKRVPERAEPKKNPRVKAERNKSWRQSAWLGLREGFWFAPTNLIEEVGVKLLGLIIGIFWVASSLTIWALARIVFPILGLCGYLVERKEDK